MPCFPDGGDGREKELREATESWLEKHREGSGGDFQWNPAQEKGEG